MITQLDNWPKTDADFLHKFDAYFLSAIVSEFSEYPQGLLGKNTFSVLLKLTFNSVDATRSQQKKELDGWFNQDISSSYCSGHLGGFLGVDFYVTAELSLSLLKKLVSASWVEHIQLCDAPVPNRRIDRAKFKPANNSEDGEVPASSKKNIVAIIDSGCPFAHQGFQNLKDEKISRFLSIWDQDERPDFHEKDGTKPIGFGYGRQIQGDALGGFITAATSSFTHHVDEDYCYKLAGYDAMLSRETHGSITLGLLASHWWSPSLSPDGKPKILPDAATQPDDADLVFVQLPRQLLLAPDKGSMERFALDGIRYILNCAGKITEQISVVLDYGSDLGSHDGSGLFEKAIDAMVTEAEAMGITLNIVFPTGNSFEKSLHARAKFDHQAVASLLWALPLGNEVPSVAEFWFDSASVCITLKVAPPNRAAISIELDVMSSQNYGNFSVTVKQIEKQTLVLIQTSPTGMFELAHRQIAPAGVWRFDFTPLKNNGSVDELQIHAYTAWGGRNEGFAQRIFAAKFIDIPNGGFEVTGIGSILSTACGEKTLAVGGYVNKPPYPRSKYSGAGPVRGGKKAQKGADYLAPTDEGYYQAGLLCMGTRSGTWLRATGTSLAAPQVARALISEGKLIAGTKKIKPQADGVKEFGEARLNYSFP